MEIFLNIVGYLNEEIRDSSLESNIKKLFLLQMLKQLKFLFIGSQVLEMDV